MGERNPVQVRAVGWAEVDTEMNRQRLQELQERWRTAESRGDDAAADAALGALFQELPLEAPRRGFAAATLARVRAESQAVAAPAASAGERTAPPAVRWAAATLALLSLGTLGLSAFVVTVLPRLALSVPVAAFNRAMIATWEWIAVGITFWSRAAEWSALLARALSVPEVGWTLVASALASLVALSLLRRILAHEKELIHAESL